MFGIENGNMTHPFLSYKYNKIIIDQYHSISSLYEHIKITWLDKAYAIFNTISNYICKFQGTYVVGNGIALVGSMPMVCTPKLNKHKVTKLKSMGLWEQS